MKLNVLIATALMLLSQAAFADPVMNENVAAAFPELVTIYPDHQDPNVFYVAPNEMSLCLDPNGVPRFSYQDLVHEQGLHGIVQMTICARNTQPGLQAAQDRILNFKPEARFVALPLKSSRIDFNPVMESFIEKQSCSHTAELIGDEKACSFRLNGKGRELFIRSVRARAVAMIMHYVFEPAGFIRMPNGSLANHEQELAIGVRIDGEELKDHPELFIDNRGNPLKP